MEEWMFFNANFLTSFFLRKKELKRFKFKKTLNVFN